MRYPEGKAKTVTFSYDDGVFEDKRLVEIFDRYGMKCTFNHNCECGRDFNFAKEEIHEYFLSQTDARCTTRHLKQYGSTLTRFYIASVPEKLCVYSNK